MRDETLTNLPAVTDVTEEIPRLILPHQRQETTIEIPLVLPPDLVRRRSDTSVRHAKRETRSHRMWVTFLVAFFVTSLYLLQYTLWPHSTTFHGTFQEIWSWSLKIDTRLKQKIKKKKVLKSF